MGIKYYELEVKKLINFNGESYALVKDVNAGLALKVDETAFNLFKNGVTQLGDAASKNIGTAVGNVVVVGENGKISSDLIPTVAVSEDLGKFESWSAAETGVAHAAEINDIVAIKDEGKETYSIYICVDPNATEFKNKFVLLKPGEGVVSLTDFLLHTGDTDIHITAEERTAWNKKLDSEDIVAGANITISVDEETGAVTITGAAPYTLPTATAEVKGGIKLGDGLEAVEGDADTIQAVAKVKETFTTNTAVGNIAKGAEISAGTTLDALLKQLLITYIDPSFSSFGSNLGGTVEVGTNIAGPVTFNWTFNDWTYTKDNIQDNTIAIRETNASGAVVAEGLAKGTTGSGSYESSITNLIKTEPGSVTYYIEGTNTKGVKFSKTLSKSWAYKYFYGTTTATTLPTAAEMRNGTGTLSPAKGTTFTVTANDGDALAWFAYPATLNDVSSIIALDSMQAEVKTGFTYGTIDMTVADGETVVSYKYGYIKPDSPFTQTARYKVTIG